MLHNYRKVKGIKIMNYLLFQLHDVSSQTLDLQNIISRLPVFCVKNIMMQQLHIMYINSYLHLELINFIDLWTAVAQW